jgi:hypothetical protein
MRKKTPETDATPDAAQAASAGRPQVKRTKEQSRNALIKKVKMFYDLQRLRMQAAGRTYKRADEDEIQLHEVDVAILEMRAQELEMAEKHALSDIKEHLQTIPFYNEVLSDKVRYRGVGPTMAGIILSAFDIDLADTVSKMWSFAGLRPIPCFRCKTCHAVVDGLSYAHPKGKCLWVGKELPEGAVYASGKAQRPQRGEKLHYNSFLRTKLVGVLAPVLLKCNSPWRKHYDDYKLRKASAKWGLSDAHRHQAAMRYMIKMLLQDIYKEWRTFLGLPARPPYAEEYLGHKHHAATNGAAVAAARAAATIDPEVAAELEQLDLLD